MIVDNTVANTLLLAARRGQRIQEFMDAIAGVSEYRLDNPNRQGHIRGMFAKEMIANQFLVDLDEIIGVFWQGVFEHLDRAKLHGEIVKIKAPGTKIEIRQTNNNPIHYLRGHGKMAVRNYLTRVYRKNLEQGCSRCGHKTSIRSDKMCPRCHNLMDTTYKFVEDHDNIHSDGSIIEVEDRDLSFRISKLLNEFAAVVLKPHTRAYQILKILVEPAASRPMCDACKLCGASSFDYELCTNYNENIGRYLGINKTFIASKIRSIRKRFPEWLQSQYPDDAEYWLQIIPTRFRS